MILSSEQIQSVTTGAVRFAEENGWHIFFRFTEEQERVFEGGARSDSQCCASVALDFTTDASAIRLDWKNVQKVANGKLLSDICVDGLLMWSFGNLSEGLGSESAEGAEQAEGEVCLPLPEGSHRIQIMLCHRCQVMLKNIDLINATFVTPYKKKLNLLCFGDSITQGHGTEHPSMTYINRLGEALNANVRNTGIGGFCFHPRLIDSITDRQPDIVTVAFGTNDWCCFTREQLLDIIGQVKAILRKHFPSAEIYVITPLWRADYAGTPFFMGKPAPCGDFIGMCEDIRKEFSEYHVIDGFNMVPHKSSFFYDQWLHPNDFGSVLYADNLRREIAKASRYTCYFQ